MKANAKASLTGWLIMFFLFIVYHYLVNFPLTQFAVKDLGKSNGFALFFACAFIALDIVWVGRILPAHVETPSYMAYIWTFLAAINAGLQTYAINIAFNLPFNWGFCVLLTFVLFVLHGAVVMPIYFSAGRMTSEAISN